MTRENLLTFLYIYLNISILLVSSSRELPSYYPRCYRDDPNLNECLLKATEQVKPYLKKGVPELGLPSISPLFIPEVTLEQGSDAVNYRASLKNVTVKGLDSYHFTKFEFDVKNLKFFGAVDLGPLQIEGDYLANGRILAVPLEGRGRLSANISNSNGTLSEEGSVVTKHGVTFLQPIEKGTEIKINIGEVNYKIDGLFDGNEILARAAKEVIKNNLKELIEDVKPVIEEVLSRIAEDIMFKSIAQIPYDKLYPVHDKNVS